jgi:hypothetical protein
LSFKLNDILLSAIAPTKAAVYGKPREAFKAMDPWKTGGEEVPSSPTTSKPSAVFC